MLTLNSRSVRNSFSNTLEAVQNESVKITRTGNKPSVYIINENDFQMLDALKKKKVQDEIDFILNRHSHVFEALADR